MFFESFLKFFKGDNNLFLEIQIIKNLPSKVLYFNNDELNNSVNVLVVALIIVAAVPVVVEVAYL